MLLVPTYLDKSAIHGIGCFAAKPIQAGAVVWQFHPEVDLAFSTDDLERLAPVN